MSAIRSFGNTVRAFRLGYAICEKRKAFIRLSAEKNGEVHVSIVPLYGKVPIKTFGKMHVVWKEKPELLDLIPALKNIKNPKKIIEFFIDAETGEMKK